MPIHNSDVVEILSKVANMLDIEGANQFRVRAYRNAARTIADLPKSVADMIERGEDLSELPGVGKDLAGKIAEIVETGALKQLEALEGRVPKELNQLLRVEGLGPKRVKALHQKLGVKSVEELKRAAQEDRVKDLDGFGKKTQQRIVEELERLTEAAAQRLKLVNAEEIAEALVNDLKKDKGVKKIDVAGSFRRRKETDGRHTLEEMAEAAKEHGYEYLAVTEHSKRVSMAKGLDAKRLAERIKKIEQLNGKLKGLRLLKSIEVDILEDGSLDLPDDILEELDLTVCSVHYNRNLSRQRQTERILRAVDNPHFHILAHPTGRLINERNPYEVDIEKIVAGAQERGCFLELNAHPDRLDLTDRHCKMAKDAGVKIAISTDAHSTTDLDFMRFGVYQARRGWLERDDVINTRKWADLKKLLGRR
jgi:histidinol phosphatase-like PHP family hydrolase